MQGTLYIISAPSGAGKTSLVREVMAAIPALRLSISHTTRPMRPGERNGVNYYFVDTAAFQAMIAADEFLEYAQVFGNYYGTSKTGVLAQLRDGHDVILEIDWQGAQQLRRAFSGTVSIFILPPSLEVLESRLRARGQDSEPVIVRRLSEARAEMAHYKDYDYIVVNEDFGRAVIDMQSILRGRSLRREAQEVALAPLLSSLLGQA